MIPAMLTFDPGTITEINLQKSNVELSGTINIDIRQGKQQQKEIVQKHQKHYELTIDFDRGKLLNLPLYVFYKDQQLPIESEWEDIWDEIDKKVNWDPINMIMPYKITTVFTGEISNSHGISCILIFASTIPDYLAITNNISSSFISYQDFFDNYFPFTDCLFLDSLIFIIISTLLSLQQYQQYVYAKKIRAYFALRNLIQQQQIR